MSDRENATYGSIGFTGLLNIVFIVLKLTGVVDWTWWNFNPFAISVLICWVWTFWLLLLVAIIFIAGAFIKAWSDRE